MQTLPLRRKPPVAGSMIELAVALGVFALLVYGLYETPKDPPPGASVLDAIDLRAVALEILPWLLMLAGSSWMLARAPTPRARVEIETRPVAVPGVLLADEI